MWDIKKCYNVRKDFKRVEDTEVGRRISKYVQINNKEELEEEMRKGEKAKGVNTSSKEQRSNARYNETRTIFPLKANMTQTQSNSKG